MAQGPVEDERLVLPERSATDRDRVFLVELVPYLHEPALAVHRLAKKLGVLRYLSFGSGYSPRAYVSAWGALRIIAIFRAQQGKLYLEGKDFHALRTRAAEVDRSRKAKRKQSRKAAAEALNIQSNLCIAIPRAGTEDEHQR